MSGLDRNMKTRDKVFFQKGVQVGVRAAGEKLTPLLAKRFYLRGGLFGLAIGLILGWGLSTALLYG